MVANCVRMVESEFAFVVNYLIQRLASELVDNLSDYKFCDKHQLMLKEKFMVVKLSNHKLLYKLQIVTN